MAFLSGIFGNSQPNAPQQQSPQQGMQQPQKAPVAPNSNGSGGPAMNQMQGNANSQMTPNANPENPLDPFLKLMTPSEEALQQQQNNPQNQSLFGNFDPTAFDAQISKTNFTSGLDQAQVQQALSGDVGAFTQILNQVAQQAFKANLQMTRGLVEQGVKTGTERFSSSLDSRFRDLQLKNQTPKHPVLSNPAVKPMLEALKQQFAAANPKMSPDQIQQHAEDYFVQLSSQFNAKPADQQQASPSQGGTDWDQWLNNGQV